MKFKNIDNRCPDVLNEFAVACAYHTVQHIAWIGCGVCSNRMTGGLFDIMPFHHDQYGTGTERSADQVKEDDRQGSLVAL